MADQNNKIKTTVELDASNAQIEINKLNAIASDSTRSLEERIEAKNKQVELQEKLSKKTISNLEKEIKALDGVAGSEKKVEALTKKLDATRVRSAKITDTNEKSQAKLNQSLKDSKSASVALDKASMGLLGALRALAANPLLAPVTLIIGALSLLKEAFTSSEEGQDSEGQGLGSSQSKGEKAAAEGDAEAAGGRPPSRENSAGTAKSGNSWDSTTSLS